MCAKVDLKLNDRMYVCERVALTNDPANVKAAVNHMPTDEWLDCLQTTNRCKQCTPYDRGTREMHVGKRTKRTRERERARERKG